MKIKVYRSRISQKRFSKPSYPRLTRKGPDEQADFDSEKAMSFKIERAPVIFSEDAAIGFYSVKNLKGIAAALKDEKDRFGTCLNKLISVYTDIVESEGGTMGKFSANGATFAFKGANAPVKAIQKSFVACLRMRYIINKLNRIWEMHATPWKLSFGVDYGHVQFQEHTDIKDSHVSLSGKPAVMARGIGLSAAGSQIIATDTLFQRHPFLETAYDVKAAYHIPVSGQEYLCKIREIVGIVGPQSKQIYEDFV